MDTREIGKVLKDEKQTDVNFIVFFIIKIILTSLKKDLIYCFKTETFLRKNSNMWK